MYIYIYCTSRTSHSVIKKRTAICADRPCNLWSPLVMKHLLPKEPTSHGPAHNSPLVAVAAMHIMWPHQLLKLVCKPQKNYSDYTYKMLSVLYIAYTYGSYKLCSPT